MVTDVGIADRGHALQGNWARVDELMHDKDGASAPATMIAQARMSLWRNDRLHLHGLLDVAWIELVPMLAPMYADPRFAANRERVIARAAPSLAAWRGPLPAPDVDAWLAEGRL